MLFRASPARSLAAAATLAVLLVAASCGQAYGREDAVAGFSAANPDATEAQSDCVIDRLIDRYGIEELEAQLQVDPPAAEFEEAQFRDMFTCGIEGDIEIEIAEQLAANGVTPEDVPCVAGELVEGLDDEGIDVLLSGEITEEFMGDFVDAMASCGAIDT